MIRTNSQNILLKMRTEELRLQQKATDKHHAAGIQHHHDQAQALADGIKALELLRAQETAGQHDPLRSTRPGPM